MNISLMILNIQEKDMESYTQLFLYTWLSLLAQ